MLKKLAAIVLTVLYLITATGFALNFYYCGNLLTAVKIDAPVKGCINAMSVKMKCCKDKQVVVKIRDAHQSATGAMFRKINSFEIAKPFFADNFVNIPLNFTLASFDRGPPDPPLSNTPAFIKNCTFRI